MKRLYLRKSKGGHSLSEEECSFLFRTGAAGLRHLCRRAKGAVLFRKREQPPLDPPGERLTLSVSGSKNCAACGMGLRRTWLRHESLRAAAAINRALCGARVTGARRCSLVSRRRMLMYDRKAQSKTRIAGSAAIPKPGERNGKIHSRMLYLISI